ncbi:hypothetical protein XNC3_2360015 [Xenorhabdus nematophila F1]|nr:hypothetical protein XNC3_2360015 [Xenorhabdus nematophila F1]CEF29921.1 hypothetical protein XNW1_210026 [Xenorhabdus nematophila str. Websteri]
MCIHNIISYRILLLLYGTCDTRISYRFDLYDMFIFLGSLTPSIKKVQYVSIDPTTADHCVDLAFALPHFDHYFQ